MERVIEELKHQHQEDLKRVTKVELETRHLNLFDSIALQERENNESLKNEICKLQEEINSLKSCHYLDNQKMKLLIANLEDNLSKEAESAKIESSKNSQLKKNIDNERELVQILKQEVMTIQEKLKQEQIRCRDEEYQKETFEKALQEEKNNIERFKKKIELNVLNQLDFWSCGSCKVCQFCATTFSKKYFFWLRQELKKC